MKPGNKKVYQWFRHKQRNGFMPCYLSSLATEKIVDKLYYNFKIIPTFDYEKELNDKDELPF